MDPSAMMNPMGFAPGMGGMGPGFGAGPRGGFGMEKVFPVVRLRGLPFNANDFDIYEFFQGLEPVDVLIVRRDGRTTGEAYVLFGNPLQMDFALQKNRQSMGRRYVEVFRSKKQDYYHAVTQAVNEPSAPQEFYNGDGGDGRPPPPHMGAGGAPPPPHGMAPGGGGGGGGGGAPPRPQQEHTGVLKMRGLPFNSTKDDIITFYDDPSLAEFSMAPLVHDSIHIVTSLDGRPSGVAFVEFASAEDSAAAMTKDRHSMGSRYVELFPSSREEATRAATAGR
uniref:RRM domain-containing protein n=1 Tax=Mantoniella antarctica TaxID=81844 RepID=A0A7S0SMT5_9CHLO|mmetsp:Transcript_31412/g.78847  ORF Transcript_31412/g.78847 Transcript_31412/m.78847 type:complete len:279 (+) Transcript_31412:97-933(+)